MPADSVPSDSNSVSEQLMDSSSGHASSSTMNSRLRTESESSDNTSTMRFCLPSIDGSPPKVLTLDEISHVFEGIQNMELAHEIALNPEFKLQPYEPPENSLEQRIKKIMHEVFWKLLREDLKKDPPCFDHAIKLLSEIKECFPQILSPLNERALGHINEVLDLTLIRQQAEQGVLDFKAYAGFIINLMAKICAPVRDEAVAKLREIEDVVDTFKGILDTMSLMKLDMVNYLLDKARNEILANSVQFEREKFRQFLQLYYMGFPLTENWLKQNMAEGDQNLPAIAQQTILNAYWSLMDWERNEEIYPEVLYMDKERILRLSGRAQRLCLCACLISICAATPIVSQRNENRKTLVKQFVVLLANLKNESEVSSTLDNVWEQIKTMLNEFLTKEGQSVMDTSAEQVLKTQIMQLKNKDAPVRKLLFKRLQQYFYESMRTRIGQKPIPAGYADYTNEVSAYVIAMKRIIAYNHSVFGDFLMQILTHKDEIKEQQNSNGNENNPAASTSNAATANNESTTKAEEK